MSFNFIPDDEDQDWKVPFLDDLTADDGWQGQSTNKSVDKLKAEIRQEIGRLGGTVTRFILGRVTIDNFERPAAQIEYQVISDGGATFNGRIDIAGPPYEAPYGGKKHHAGYNDSLTKKRESSLSVALFNVQKALQAMRILQMLSPGYAALIPWMITEKSGKTLGEIWNMGAPALPAPKDDDESVDGIFREVDG